MARRTSSLYLIVVNIVYFLLSSTLDVAVGRSADGCRENIGGCYVGVEARECSESDNLENKCHQTESMIVSCQFKLFNITNFSSFLILNWLIFPSLGNNIPVSLSLAISVSCLTLTCIMIIMPFSIESTLYPNLAIFISETSVEFVIFFIFLQLQRFACKFTCLQQTWLVTTAIHYTLAYHRQISYFNSFKTHWPVSLQTL